MAKERSDKEVKEKREKREKKEKRSDKDGVHKSKKDKKEKKLAANGGEVVTKLLNTLEEEKPGTVAIKENGDVEVKVKVAPPIGALVPFANPLADEKVGKKVLKSVKKGMRMCATSSLSGG